MGLKSSSPAWKTSVPSDRAVSPRASGPGVWRLGTGLPLALPTPHWRHLAPGRRSSAYGQWVLRADAGFLGLPHKVRVTLAPSCNCPWGLKHLAPSLPAEPPAPQALTCGQGQAKGRPVKLVQEVHAVIAAGLQHVAVCVRQVRWQHGEQAGLGGQAPRVLRPQPGVPRGGPPGSGVPRGGPQAQACRAGHPWPVFSDEVMGPSL